MVEDERAVTRSTLYLSCASRHAFCHGYSVPRQLPALIFAKDVFKQVKKLNLEAPEFVDEAAVSKLAKDLDKETTGKQLFEIAAACRLKGIDPESALRRYTQTIVDTLEQE